MLFFQAQFFFIALVFKHFHFQFICRLAMKVLLLQKCITFFCPLDWSSEDCNLRAAVWLVQIFTSHSCHYISCFAGYCVFLISSYRSHVSWLKVCLSDRWINTDRPEDFLYFSTFSKAYLNICQILLQTVLVYRRGVWETNWQKLRAPHFFSLQGNQTSSL